MEKGAPDMGWIGYALSGRPDFLNYLHRGDVSWPELWEFYRRHPADTDAMLRVMRLFHMFQSHAYDADGCVLDEDSPVYRHLQAWAGFVVEAKEFVPEEKLLASLADLLDQSLVSALYYAAVFGVYVEAMLDEAVRTGRAVNGGPPAGRPAGPEGRNGLRLPEVPRLTSLEDPHWKDAVHTLVGQRYAAWNHAYQAALGDPSVAWTEEGGEG